MAIADQLDRLNVLRQNLAAALTAKNVEAAETEGFETLVPKVLEISGAPADTLKLMTMELTSLETVTLPVSPEYAVITWHGGPTFGSGADYYINVLLINNGTDSDIVYAAISSKTNSAKVIGTGSLSGNTLSLPSSTSYFSSKYPATLYMFYKE